MSNGRWCSCQMTPDHSANSFLQWNRLKFVDQVDEVKPLRWMLGGLAMQKSIKNILIECLAWMGENCVAELATRNRKPGKALVWEHKSLVSKDAFGPSRILIRRRVLHKYKNLNSFVDVHWGLLSFYPHVGAVDIQSQHQNRKGTVNTTK